MVYIYLNKKELEVLEEYTKISTLILNKIKGFFAEACNKRRNVKKVKIYFTMEELNDLVYCITEEANKKNVSYEVQFYLDSMFGRFADKYNEFINN